MGRLLHQEHALFVHPPAFLDACVELTLDYVLPAYDGFTLGRFHVLIRADQVADSRQDRLGNGQVVAFVLGISGADRPRPVDAHVRDVLKELQALYILLRDRDNVLHANDQKLAVAQGHDIRGGARRVVDPRQVGRFPDLSASPPSGAPGEVVHRKVASRVPVVAWPALARRRRVGIRRAFPQDVFPVKGLEAKALLRSQRSHNARLLKRVAPHLNRLRNSHGPLDDAKELVEQLAFFDQHARGLCRAIFRGVRQPHEVLVLPGLEDGHLLHEAQLVADAKLALVNLEKLFHVHFLGHRHDAASIAARLAGRIPGVASKERELAESSAGIDGRKDRIVGSRRSGLSAAVVDPGCHDVDVPRKNKVIMEGFVALADYDRARRHPLVLHVLADVQGSAKV